MIEIERYEQIAGEDRPVFSFYRFKYFAYHTRAHAVYMRLVLNWFPTNNLDMVLHRFAWD